MASLASGQGDMPISALPQVIHQCDLFESTHVHPRVREESTTQSQLATRTAFFSSSKRPRCLTSEHRDEPLEIDQRPHKQTKIGDVMEYTGKVQRPFQEVLSSRAHRTTEYRPPHDHRVDGMKVDATSVLPLRASAPHISEDVNYEYRLVRHFGSGGAIINEISDDFVGSEEVDADYARLAQFVELPLPHDSSTEPGDRRNQDVQNALQHVEQVQTEDECRNDPVGDHHTELVSPIKGPLLGLASGAGRNNNNPQSDESAAFPALVDYDELDSTEKDTEWEAGISPVDSPSLAVGFPTLMTNICALGHEHTTRADSTSPPMHDALRQLIESDENAPITKSEFLALAAILVEIAKHKVHQVFSCPTVAPSPAPSPAPDDFSRVREYQPKRRPNVAITLQNHIRRHASHLLNRNTNKEPFTRVPPEQEVDAYKARGIGGPTAENFSLDFDGGMASPWNKQAIEVFAEDFIHCDLYGPAEKTDVKCAFKAHFRTLRKQYDQLHGAANSDEERFRREAETQNARDQRRRTLRNKRAAACGAHPDLERFAPLWKTIPFEAMSGDESDDDQGKKRYAITNLSWRSEAVTAWLRTFDYIHLSTRFNSKGGAKRGALPHPRIPSCRMTHQDKYAPGLPRNFYDPTWLLGRDEASLAALQMQPEQDLTHSPAVLSVAERYKDVHGRKLV